MNKTHKRPKHQLHIFLILEYFDLDNRVYKCCQQPTLLVIVMVDFNYDLKTLLSWSRKNLLTYSATIITIMIVLNYLKWFWSWGVAHLLSWSRKTCDLLCNSPAHDPQRTHDSKSKLQVPRPNKIPKQKHNTTKLKDQKLKSPTKSIKRLKLISSRL